MLPPTYAGTTTPCTTANASYNGMNQVLVFGGVITGGQSAINCLNGVNGGFGINPSNGYVGIGTASPAYTLDVYANSASLSNIPTVAAINGTTGANVEAQLLLATGTPDSYVSSTLVDNNTGVSGGVPQYYLGTGSAVTAGAVFNFAQLNLIGGSVAIGKTAAPVASLDDSANTDAVALPSGSTSQEPGSPVTGMFRYNTDNNVPEYYNGSAWQAGGPPSGRTWHSIPSFPGEGSCIQNTAPNEMVVALDCQTTTAGESYIVTSPSSSCTGGYTAAHNGVAHAYGISTFGVQGTIPAGWYWAWTSAACTCTGGNELY